VPSRPAPKDVTAQPKQDSNRIIEDPNVKTDSLRRTPGRVTGGDNLPTINGNWFGERPGPNGNIPPGRIAPIPKQIAQRLKNIGDFRSFEDLRQTFWRLVAEDPGLAPPGGWRPSNMTLMRNGQPPQAHGSQQTGGGSNAVLQLNHRQALEHAGEVYDLDNLEVVTPKMHEDMRM
jgi:uncharacterized protein